MSIDKACQEICRVVKERNQEYGDTNLLEYGLLGLVIRIHDKLGRIKTALVRGNVDVVRDALIDIGGYAVNGLRLLDEGKLTPLGRAMSDFALFNKEEESC